MLDCIDAAHHESGHMAISRSLGARFNVAHIWPTNGDRWAGSFRHGRPGDLDPIGERILHVAGGAAEALLHGFNHPGDAAQFVSSGDAARLGVDSADALLRVPTVESDIRYAMRALSGPLRQAWAHDAATLIRDRRAGDWRRLPKRMLPVAWIPPIRTGGNPMPNSDQYVDAFSAMHAFLSEKLTPDDLSKVEALLEELIRSFNSNGAGSPLAADASLRPSPSYAARFPNSGRLQGAY